MPVSPLPPLSAVAGGAGGMAGDAKDRLAPFASVCHALEERGVGLARRSGETRDQQENRLATGLMSLYRDTRRPDAFEALYAFARPTVLAWIRSLLRRGLPHLDPIELLQDTFVNVYRYPRGFRAEHAGSFRVWVRTIAGNLVRRASAPAAPLSFQQLPGGLREPEDRQATPFQRTLLEEQERRLRSAWMIFLAHYGRACEDLSARDRRTLHLVEVEGRSYAEAGQRLGVGHSNMKMIVFRSRKRIARRMRQAMNGAVLGPPVGRDVA